MTEKIFQEKVFCYRDSMYRFAGNLLNNESEAQDTVQVVMLKMWQQKERLNCIEPIKPYLMQAVKNECINKMRHHKMRGKHLCIAGAQQPLTVDNHPGNMAKIIHAFIATLPEKQKLVMLLKDVEECETTEIAAMMEMEETAVRTNLARARQKVREYLKKIETYEQQQVQ